MYETAEVLEHKNRKIWVKRVNETLYCVNGRFFVFHTSCNISDPAFLAKMLDTFYSPDYKNAREAYYLLSVAPLTGHADKRTCKLAELRNCPFDTKKARPAVSEYERWASVEDKDDIYINDFRDKTMEAWLESIN